MPPPRKHSVKSPTWPIATVKAMLVAGNYEIKDPGLTSARIDFGFSDKEVVVYLKKHMSILNFSRTNPHKFHKGVFVDHYEIIAGGLEVYAHLHIYNGKLYITSFKER